VARLWAERSGEFAIHKVNKKGYVYGLLMANLPFCWLRNGITGLILGRKSGVAVGCQLRRFQVAVEFLRAIAPLGIGEAGHGDARPA
jgi:hypothetical protein